MVTAITWSSDGTQLSAGTLHGKCRCVRQHGAGHCLPPLLQLHALWQGRGWLEGGGPSNLRPARWLVLCIISKRQLNGKIEMNLHAGPNTKLRPVHPLACTHMHARTRSHARPSPPPPGRRHYDWVPNTPSPTPSALAASLHTHASTAAGGSSAAAVGGAPQGHGVAARLDYVANIDVKDRRAGAAASGRKVRARV